MFLFLKEGVLTRDPQTDSVLNTYFCEKQPEVFNEISQLIGPHDSGFMGDFQDMILFEDDDETRGLCYHDVSERYSASLRRRLLTKERHQRFRSAVPFDVINLDICGSFFPPSGGVLSPMLRSIRRLLDWQTEFAEGNCSFNSFTLFLTAHVECGRVNEDAMKELITMVEDNQATYNDFSRKLSGRFGTSDANRIVSDDFAGFYCVALPKVIVGSGFDRGWRVMASFSGRYQRVRETEGKSYSMLAWVGRFDRHQPRQLPLGRSQTPSEREYAELISGLTDEPEDVDEAAREVKREIEADLETIVAFRENYQDKIRFGT